MSEAPRPFDEERLARIAKTLGVPARSLVVLASRLVARDAGHAGVAEGLALLEAAPHATRAASELLTLGSDAFALDELDRALAQIWNTSVRGRR